MAITHQCPHCESRAVAEESRKVTRLVRDLYFRCTNIDCGATLKGQLAIVAQLSPSAQPHPEVRLPIIPPRRKANRYRPANDDFAPQEDAVRA